MKKWNWGTFEKLAFTVLGIRARIFLNQITHWRKYKGDEWLVTRWKAIHNSAYLLRNGDFQGASDNHKSAGIAMRDGTQVSKGPFGTLQLLFMKAERPSWIRCIDGLLRGYTGILSPTLTQTQVKKHRESITGITTRDTKRVNMGKRGIQGATKAYLPRFIPTKKDLQSQKLDVHMYGMSGNRSYFTGKYRPSPSVKRRPYGQLVTSALTVGYVPTELLEFQEDRPLRQAALHHQMMYDNLPEHLGKISFIHEGGMKVRVIAVPSFWVQVYTRRLQLQLLNVIRELEAEKGCPGGGYSVVGQGDKALWQLTEWMKTKEELYSFDLSSATDTFPLDLQAQLLDQLGLGYWNPGMAAISRGKWWVSDLSETWSYSTGQPMGVSFSFPLFHLTHWALLAGTLSKVHIENDGPRFMVLGDDVIIRGGEFAEIYKSLLEGFGVKISKGKSLGGNRIQTFSGGTSIRGSKGVTTYIPFRFGPNHTIAGRSLGFLHAFGSKVRSWSKVWERDYIRFSKTLDQREHNLSPIIGTDRRQYWGQEPDSPWLTSLSQVVCEDLLLPDYFHLGTSRIWPGEWAHLTGNSGRHFLTAYSPQPIRKGIRWLNSLFRLYDDPLMREVRKLEKVQASGPPRGYHPFRR